MGLHSLLKIASLKISEDFLTTFQLSRESLATSVQTPAHQTPHNYRSRHLPSTKVTSPPPATSPEATRATPPLPSVTAVYLTIIYLNPRTVWCVSVCLGHHPHNCDISCRVQ